MSLQKSQYTVGVVLLGFAGVAEYDSGFEPQYEEPTDGKLAWLTIHPSEYVSLALFKLTPKTLERAEKCRFLRPQLERIVKLASSGETEVAPFRVRFRADEPAYLSVTYRSLMQTATKSMAFVPEDGKTYDFIQQIDPKYTLGALSANSEFSYNLIESNTKHSPTYFWPAKGRSVFKEACLELKRVNSD